MSRAQESSASTPAAKVDLTYHAPILCVDLLAFNEDGEPFEIWPCDHCLPWRVEIVHADDWPGGVAAREWHAAECPRLLHWLNDGDEG